LFRNGDPEDTQVTDWPGISAITLFVEDLDAARTFYEAAFGLPMHFEDQHSVVFKFGDTLLNLLVEPAVPELISPAACALREAGSRVVLTITVDDVDPVCLELANKGIDLLNGPMDRPWGIRTASFIDPDGYIWEIAK
jgi:catechol 2,3-dioxygenase-like lactoylglutathione lyase family enzyme